MVTVFSKPACVQCQATIRKLNDSDIEYNVVNVAEDPDGLDFVKQLGYLQVPVVVSDIGHWSGFRPDKISELA